MTRSTVEQVLVGAMEAGAMAAGPWIGKGDKNSADQAAVDAIESSLDNNDAFTLTVVIGEGDKDVAPMLVHDSKLGQNPDVEFDFAVDPIDGTTVVAEGRDNGISTGALTPKSTMQPWVDLAYAMKLAVGPKAAHLLENGDVRLDEDPEQNLKRIAEALGKDPTELQVAMLDRPRNSHIKQAIEAIGAEPVLLEGGDITPALNTSVEGGGLDVLYSSGGAPELVLATAGVAALGGNMQGMWDPQTDDERARAEELGQLGVVLDMEKLIGNGEVHFAMTAITNVVYAGRRLKGVTQENGLWLPGESIYLSRAA